MFERNQIPSISVAEAHARLTSGVATSASDGALGPLLVDVREASEYREVRAEGAALVPLSVFMARYRELPTDRPLLMICRTGARSGQATAFLLANGWTDVVNVSGGTLAWAQAGLPVREGPPLPGEADLPA